MPKHTNNQEKGTHTVQPIDLVFWDWNGTLLDDVNYSLGCLNGLLAQYGYPQRYSLEAYREIFGFPIEEYYRRVGFDFHRDPYPVLAQSYMDRYNAGVEECAPTATAASTLEALRSLGKRQVILSASRRDYLIEQASQRGLKGYFSELLGLSDIYGVSKIQLGLDFLAESGVDPARCLMIGDTDHDAQVAAALGAKCVLFTGGHQSRKRLESVCDTVIDRLDQLPDLLG